MNDGIRDLNRETGSIIESCTVRQMTEEEKIRYGNMSCEVKPKDTDYTPYRRGKSR